MFSEICDFCYAIRKEVDWGHTPEYRSHCGNLKTSRVFWKSPSSFAMVALGPVSIGNSLFIPHEHFRSLAEVPADRMQILANELAIVRAGLEARVGDIVTFEHGMASIPEDRDSCMDHVHIQFLPTSINILTEVQQDLDMEGVPISSVTELVNFGTEAPYLYVSDNASFSGRVFTANDLPSQYIRRMFLRVAGDNSSWSWRVDPRCEDILNSIAKIGVL